MDINQTLKLLSEFRTLPKSIYEPTYLELCRYPKRRFEEICSRLLCFCFNPYEIHGLKSLFLKSFFELIDPNYIFSFSQQTLKIIDEENAYGRRIDIVIEDTDFVIGIENKIDALLYNDLSTYSRHIDNKNKRSFKIVLSLKPIILSDKASSGFINITYQQFFTKVKSNIGQYLSSSNTKYLSHVLDFIKTIENMELQHSDNPELDLFFFSNYSELQNFSTSFNDYKNRVRQRQLKEVRDLVIQLKEITKDPFWKTYELEDCASIIYGRDLFGLEADFTATKESPLGLFQINITTWENNWEKYGNEIKKIWDLPHHNVGKKTFIKLEPIDGTNPEIVSNQLINLHNRIQDVFKSVLT